jgi:hypothetical protein
MYISEQRVEVSFLGVVGPAARFEKTPHLKTLGSESGRFKGKRRKIDSAKFESYAFRPGPETAV